MLRPASRGPCLARVAAEVARAIVAAVGLSLACTVVFARSRLEPAQQDSVTLAVLDVMVVMVAAVCCSVAFVVLVYGFEPPKSVPQRDPLAPFKSATALTQQ